MAYEDTYSVDLESIEGIKRYGSQEVQQEPAADVVDGNELGLIDHLTTLAHIRGAEVQDDVWHSGHGEQL